MKRLFTLLTILMASFGQTNAQQCFANATSFISACDTNCTGMVNIVFTGTAMPIQISFNGQPAVTVTTTFQIGGLCAGVYNFVAIDANGDTCSGMTSVTVMQTPAISFTVSTVNATCTQCNDGAATVNISAGTPPFSYLWSQGSTTQSLTGLSPGVYTVTITDANGCSSSQAFTIGVGINGFIAITGTVYLDLNQNGILDTGEPGLPNHSVSTSPGAVSSLTDFSGLYVSIVTPGTYNISYPVTPGWNITSLPVSYDTTVTTASIANLDFGLYPDSTSASAYTTITSNFPRCLQNVLYSPYVYNNGFTMLNGTMEFTYDPAQTFVSSVATPVSHIGNTLTYSFTNLLPGYSFNPNVTLLEPGGGTLVSMSSVMNASDAFGNIIIDTTNFVHTINCSYDPNDKAVSPSGAGPLNYVSMDSWLTYHIRFQNTGTDTAFKVVILDTLDASLDVSTFSVIGASHPLITNISPSREVSFIFDNILLPDSNVNEPASHGYVTYAIKGMSNNPDPSEVTNTAYIYFDLNSPVETNTTLTTFSDNWLGINENPVQNNIFTAFPNPASSKITVQLNQPHSENYSLTMLDIAGRVVGTPGILGDQPVTIDCSSVSPGVYLLKAEGSSVAWMRLIIQ